MSNNTIRELRKNLVGVFGKVNDWTSVENDLKHYSPLNKGWTVARIVEHIHLTNHFLLILIRKGAAKSLKQSAAGEHAHGWSIYRIDEQLLRAIGEHQSFEWPRPAHMYPSDNPDMETVRKRLKEQLEECLVILYRLRNGEGSLHKTMMSVNGIGKIDVYHYIYFLAQHAKRHLMQMEKIKREFEDVAIKTGSKLQGQEIC